MFGQTNVNSEYVRLIQLTDTAFANFENEVSFDVNLFSSDVTTDDLAWFAPELKKLDLKAKIKGKVTGPLRICMEIITYRSFRLHKTAYIT